MNKETILVVGGAKGGAETAQYFIDHLNNPTMIIADIAEPTSIRGNYEFVPTNVYDERSIDGLVKRINEISPKGVDHYTNFVGGVLPQENRFPEGHVRSGERKRFIDLSVADINASIDHNYTQQLILLSKILPLMIGNEEIEHENRSVVLISSINATSGRFQNPVYTSSKSALLEPLLRTIGNEVGRYGIRMNAVAPGTLPSARTQEQGKNFGGLCDTTMTQRFVTSQEVAQAIYFMTRMTGVTGEILKVDRGQSGQEFDVMNTQGKSTGL